MSDAASMTVDPPAEQKPLDGDIGAMAFVQAASLCRGIPETELNKLYEAGEVLGYAGGELACVEGAEDDFLYLVFEGTVVIQKMHAGADVEITTLERQGVFGETEVLTQQPRGANVVTRTETRLIRFPGAVIREVADAAPKLGKRLAALMAGRTRETETKLQG